MWCVSCGEIFPPCSRGGSVAFALVLAIAACHPKPSPAPGEIAALDLPPADCRTLVLVPKVGPSLEGLSGLTASIAEIPGAEIVAQWSAQLANLLGQDVRTASGREALGLDSDRPALLWILKGKSQPVFALPAKDLDKLEAGLKARGQLSTARRGSFILAGANAADLAVPATPASRRAELRTLFDELGARSGGWDALIFNPAAEPGDSTGDATSFLPSLGTSAAGVDWSSKGLKAELRLLPLPAIAAALGTLGTSAAPSAAGAVKAPIWVSLGGEPSAWGALAASKLKPFDGEAGWLKLLEDVQPGIVVEAGLSAKPTVDLAAVHALATVRDAAAAQKQIAGLSLPAGWQKIALHGQTLELTFGDWGEGRRLASLPKPGTALAAAAADTGLLLAEVAAMTRDGPADGLAAATMHALMTQITGTLGRLGTVTAQLRTGAGDWILDLDVPLRS